LKKHIIMIICLALTIDTATTIVYPCESGKIVDIKNEAIDNSSYNNEIISVNNSLGTKRYFGSKNTDANENTNKISNVSADIDSNKQVTVSGNISSGGGQQVTIRILDPNNNLEYLNNTTSRANGSFTFSYAMNNTLKGRYKVSIGAAEILSPVATYFDYGIDADLKDLSISSGAFSEAFTTEKTAYTESVDNSVESITVTPTLSDSNAAIYVKGIRVLSGQESAPINLDEGSNTINVVVTAQDGTTTKTYTITVTREKTLTTGTEVKVEANIDSNKLVTVKGIVSSGAGQQVSIIIKDPTGNIEYLNNTTSTKEGHFTFSYTMTNTIKGKYNVSIGGVGILKPVTTYFEYAVNADLKDLSISSGAFDQAFAAGTSAYTESVDNYVDCITVTPTLIDSNASVMINGRAVLSGQSSEPIELKEGSNTINVVTTAQDGTTTKAYTITVTRAKVLTTNLTAKANIDDKKKVTVNGTVSTGAGQQITIMITDPDKNIEYLNNVTSSEDGKFSLSYTMSNNTKGKYKVTVGAVGLSEPIITYFTYGKLSKNADLKDLKISSGNLDKAFESGTTSYNVSVESNVNSITLTPIVDEKHATVTVKDLPVSDGEASDEIELNMGENHIDVIVTAQDGITTKLYTVTVYRKEAYQPQPQIQYLSSDATLSNLILSQGSFNDSAEFNSGITTYYANVANSVSSITVTPTVNENHAAVKVNGVAVGSGNASGAINLNVGNNTIIVEVKAQDGSTKTYTITVIRDEAVSEPLSSDEITIENNLGISEDIVSVNGLVSGDVVNIYTSATDSGAIATISDGASFVVVEGGLNPAGGTIYVSITHTGETESSRTAKDYSAELVPPVPSSDATLSNLTISQGSFNDPAEFNSEITTYYANVANNVSSIAVTPTVNENHATLKVNGLAVGSGNASGTIDLNVGNNTIIVEVKAQDGSTKTYTITVTREEAVSEALSSDEITIENNLGILDDMVAVNGLVSGDVVNIYTSATDIGVIATISDGASYVVVEGGLNSAGGTIYVSITRTGETESSRTAKDYAAELVPPVPSSDATLSNLTISQGSFNDPAEFNSEITTYYANVVNSVSSITVTPTVNENHATVKVNGVAVGSGNASGTINLNVGNNTIIVEVKAQDGSTKTYTITVIREEAVSEPLSSDEITIENNVGISEDMVAVNGLVSGDVVNIYTSATESGVIATIPDGASYVVVAGGLNSAGGTIYVSITHTGETESSRTAKDYAAEH